MQKVILITGANSGIGKAAAASLAAGGHHIIMVCRHAERGRAAQAEIQASTGSRTVDLLLADLSSQAEIRTLAERVLANYPVLNVLINNAGIVTIERTFTVDGIESTLATNHLGPLLLSQLLLPRLQASAPARIVNVSSAIHRMASLDLDDLEYAQRDFKFMRAYAQSKLLMNMVSFEMARQVAATGVTVNCLHPGGVSTHLGSDSAKRYAMQWLDKLVKVFMMSPEKAAQTVVYLATSPEVETVTGQYFVKNKAVNASAPCYDEALVKRVWDISNALIGVS